MDQQQASSSDNPLGGARRHFVCPRDLANLRERRRMMLINRGFELLKSKLPINEMSSRVEDRSSSSHANKRPPKKRRSRLTKVDILRLTVDYIKHLNDLLYGTDSGSGQDLEGGSSVIESSVTNQLAITASWDGRKAPTSRRRNRLRMRARRLVAKTKLNHQVVGDDGSSKKPNNSLIVTWACESMIDNLLQTTQIRYKLSWSRAKSLSMVVGHKLRLSNLNIWNPDTIT